MSREREISYILQDSRFKVLICLEELYQTVAKNILTPTITTVITTSPLDFLDPESPQKYSRIFSSVKRLHCKDSHQFIKIVDFMELINKYDNQHPPSIDLAPEDPAMLTYTSGTTGPPKGAINTHKNLVFNAYTSILWLKLKSDGVSLMVAPFFHITGLHLITVSVLSPMQMVLTYRFDPAICSELIKRYSVTFILGAITVFIALLNEPLVKPEQMSSLECLYSGGSPISPSTVEQFKKKVRSLDSSCLWTHRNIGSLSLHPCWKSCSRRLQNRCHRRWIT